MTWRDYYHLCIIPTVEMLPVDTLAGFTDARARFLISYRRNRRLHRIESLNSTKSLSTFFWHPSFFFPAPCTKKYSGPGDLRYLSTCYGFHTHQPLHVPPPSPTSTSLACLISSHSFARALLCPRAEVAHLLCLGTDFKGPGHIWLLRSGLWSPQDPEGLGQDGDCNQQNCCWWRIGLLWDFSIFFSRKESSNQSYLWSRTQRCSWWWGMLMMMIMGIGWYMNCWQGKKIFGHLAPKLLHLPE